MTRLLTVCHWLSGVCVVFAAVTLIGHIWVSASPLPEPGQTNELVLWGILRDRGLYLTGGWLVAALFLQWDRVVAAMSDKPAKSDGGQNP